MFTIRAPKAAGIVYNSDSDRLDTEIEMSFKHRNGPGKIESKKIIAAISPHGKYHISGSVAAWTFSRLEKSNYIIIGPNHFDLGSRFAIMKEGLWKTPFGEIAIDGRVAQKIIDKSKIVDYDVIAHDNEHSIEAQLPFLQWRFGNDFKLVPISIRNRFADKDFVETCKAIGKSLAQSIISDKGNWKIIATSDFSAGIKDEVEKKDRKIINSIKNLSENNLFDAIHKTNSRICGYGAIITALSAAKELGARQSKLLKYSTSFETIQDPKSVQGYASIIIY